MTIAHVNLARGFRGGERQTELLIRALAARGVSQRLVARTGEPLIVRLADIDTLDRRAVGGIVGAARALRGARLSHAHEGRCVQATALARWFAGTPYVITRRDVRPLGRNAITRRIYRDASALVAISSAVHRQLSDYAPEHTPHTIPSAFTPAAADPDRARALRRQFGPGPVVGHVGALVSRHKGQHLLIEAARRRPDWRVVLVGGGADEGALREQAGGLDNVLFTGHVDDVASHIAAFELFAFPSLFEGLGSTLLDVIQQGVPVVASRTGGIPDIIEHERNGLLVEPGDVDGLIAAIDRLLDDRALQQRFAEANREIVQRFSAERMADQYQALYEALLA